MSKFIVLADGHFQGVNSVNRIGNYYQDWLKKWSEMLQIALTNNCEAIIDLGDLFHTKSPAYAILDEICDTVESFEIPLYSLLGNHVLSFGHLENSKSVGLIHLQKRSKFFKYLTELQGKDYFIKGFEYSTGCEEKLKNDGVYFNDDKKWHILATHCLITPKPFFQNTSYVIPKEVKTNADLVLCSHYHQPFEQKVGNIVYKNIGCFGRLSITEAKIKPTVLLLDTEIRSYKEIILQSSKSAEEAFDLTKYEENKEKEIDISLFLEAMQNVNLQEMDFQSQLNYIGKENNVEKEVINYLLDIANKIKE